MLVHRNNIVYVFISSQNTLPFVPPWRPLQALESDVRVDGRRTHDSRKLEFQLGLDDASCLLKLGKTKARRPGAFAACCNKPGKEL